MKKDVFRIKAKKRLKCWLQGNAFYMIADNISLSTQSELH